MNTHDWPCRIKSARQKRRLVKTDRDKQLIQLDKRRDELWQQKRELPWVALDEPYQSGWKRYFVLRDDIKRSPRAEFYEALLKKINTVEYHHDRSFKRKKRRKGRYVYNAREQKLREFDYYEWHSSKLKLSEPEKACFTRVESYSIKKRSWQITYVFTEPWRYKLKVFPNMITHKKPLDLEIERELSYIGNYIDNRYLGPRIARLTRGKCYRYYDWYDERAKYINYFKNTPRYSPKQAYLDLDI